MAYVCICLVIVSYCDQDQTKLLYLNMSLVTIRFGEKVLIFLAEIEGDASRCMRDGN